MLNDIQEFVRRKEEKEHFSQCGSKKWQPEQNQEDMIIHNVSRKPKALYCGWSKAKAKEAGNVNMKSKKKKNLRQKAGLYFWKQQGDIDGFQIKGDKNKSIF